MKKKIFITLTIIILPIATFCAGVYASAWFYNKLLDPYTMSAGEASTTYATLSMLRDGDQNRAIALLEGNLNSSLIIFSNLDHLKDEEQKEKYSSMLGKIRSYREQYPYSSGNDEIDLTVNKVLSYGTEN